MGRTSKWKRSSPRMCFFSERNISSWCPKGQALIGVFGENWHSLSEAGSSIGDFGDCKTDSPSFTYTCIGSILLVWFEVAQVEKLTKEKLHSIYTKTNQLMMQINKTVIRYYRRIFGCLLASDSVTRVYCAKSSSLLRRHKVEENPRLWLHLIQTVQNFQIHSIRWCRSFFNLPTKYIYECSSLACRLLFSQVKHQPNESFSVAVVAAWKFWCLRDLSLQKKQHALKWSEFEGFKNRLPFFFLGYTLTSDGVYSGD